MGGRLCPDESLKINPVPAGRGFGEGQAQVEWLRREDGRATHALRSSHRHAISGRSDIALLKGATLTPKAARKGAKPGKVSRQPPASRPSRKVPPGGRA